MKWNHKWSTLMLAAGAMLALGLAGCSSKGASDGGGSTGSKTLTVGFWKGDSPKESEARDTLFKNFTKDTGIKIKQKVYNDYNTQLMTDLVGGTAPDVFYVDSSLLPSLQTKGVLESLSSYMKKDKYDASDFYAPTYKAFTGDDGKQYGLPKDYSTMGLYYNADLLKKAGYTANDIPKTDTEFLAFLKKLKTKLPGVTPMTISPLLARQMFIMQSTGAKIITKSGKANLSDPKVVSALQPLIDADAKDKTVRTFKELGFGSAMDAFGSQKTVFSDEGAWQVSGLKTNFKDLNWGTTEFPTINGQKANMIFTVGWSMNAASKQKDDAWRFIKFVTSKKQSQQYSTTASVLPSRKSVAKAMGLTDNKEMAPFVAAANYATPWIAGVNLDTIQSRYENIIPSAFQGKVTLADALKQATDSANKDIAKQDE
ncbi:ABC transporter substrate-binding protein [Lacticaseibacillus absianus]|uniref:ABC transporter substrate-binding protein n=1 Tax=Lacticaseibacillus absianus TaxID=2729623 RepID=UPI0015CE2DF7|nr:ABC transporter substrate-binding protein [Lacticaseibacillus absianus]